MSSIGAQRAPRRLTLYSKPGCHLCDVMKQVIDAVSARIPLTLDVVDISQDPALTERYGLEIPVLLIEGKKAAKYRLTERELLRKLEGSGFREQGAGLSQEPGVRSRGAARNQDDS